MIGLFCAIALVKSAYVGESLTTKFLPSLDLPSIQNPRTTYALDGGCNGGDEMANVFYKIRTQLGGKPLHDLTNEIMTKHSEEYLKRVLGIAQLHADMAGTPEFSATLDRTDPNIFMKSIVDTLRTHEPVSIVFGNSAATQVIGTDNKVNHRITIYGADEVNGQWIFRVADTNAPPSQVDQVRLRFDPVKRAFVETTANVVSDQWSQAGTVKAQIKRPEDYAIMIKLARQGTPYAEIQAASHANPVHDGSVPNNGATIHSGPGGVLIQFDPAIFNNTVDEKKLAEMEKHVQEFLNSGQHGAVVIRLEPVIKKLVLVPLKSIRLGGDLGGLTRVSGFVRASDGSILLAGLREPGHTAIPSDFLMVAIQGVFKKGAVPFISLDPDMSAYGTLPGAIGSITVPQNTRTGGLPEGLTQTSFIKAMFEADYEMKRLTLGINSPIIPGFRRWFDLLKDVPTSQQNAVRHWLCSLPSPAGDVYVYRSSGSVAMLFESLIGVQSESQRFASGTFRDAGNDPVADESARQMTIHYDQLAEIYPKLYELHGVFDLCKLCSAWRSLNIQSTDFEPWLAGKPSPALIPHSYAGLGPISLGDGLASVSGGAIANASIVTGAAVETDRLAGMLNKPDGGEVTIELPSVLPVSASTLAGFEAQILMKRAERDFADGLSEEALQRVDAVLQITPDFALAHELRAQILATANRLPEAISETGWLKNHHSQMDEALIAESRILAVQLKGLASPEGTDSSDVDEVVAQYPNDEMVLMQAISAKMSSQDFEGATKILYQTWDLSPTNPLIKMMDTEIAVCKRLTKSAAHRRAVMYASLPIPVLAAYLQVAMGDDFEESKQILGKFDTGVLPSPPDAYFSEQLRFLISSRLTLAAMKGKTVDMEFVANSATKLIQDHPKWQSGYYLNLLYLSMKQAPNEQVLAVSRQMAEKTVGGDDPIFATYGDRVFGSQYVATLASTLFCLDSSIPTDQRRAWLQLAIDSAPASSKPFLNAVAAESGVDFAVLIESDGRKGFSGTREELLNMLNRVTAMAADIKPDDPAFVLALVLGSGPLSSNMPCTLDFVETCSRALKQSRMSLPSALSNYGLMRSVAWLNGAEMVQSLALNARSAITQDEKAGLAELDNQYGANPPAMTIDRLRILLKNRLKVSLSDRAAMLMNEKDRIEQLATDQGDWIAAIVGIIRATKENGPPMSSFILNPLKNKFPGIEDTEEFKSMKQSLDTEEPKSQEVIKTLWQRIMAGISTLSDGTAIEQLVGLIISKNRMLPMPILNLLHECRSAIQARNKMGYLINPRPGK